jgi:predicted alpha/beta hydrolase
MSSITEAVEKLAAALGAPGNDLSLLKSRRIDSGSGSIMFGSDVTEVDDAYHAYVRADGDRVVIYDARGVGSAAETVADAISWEAEEFARVVLPVLVQALRAS